MDAVLNAINADDSGYGGMYVSEVQSHRDPAMSHQSDADTSGRLDEKSILETCTKLAELVSGRLDSRRQVEWRVHFLLWAALAAGIVTFRAAALPIAGAIIPITVYVQWLRSIKVRFEEDSAFIWHYINHCQDILHRNGVVSRESVHPFERSRFRFGGPMPLQLVFTLLLVVTAYAVCADEVTWFEFALGPPGQRT